MGAISPPGAVGTTKKRSPRVQFEMMIKKESESRLGVTKNTITNYIPTLKYEKYDKLDNSRNQSRAAHESPFGRAGEQTLSTAVRSRLILKNSYGMPKERARNFKPTNTVEAKASIGRTPTRDAATIRHDEEVLKFLREEHERTTVPTIKAL